MAIANDTLGGVNYMSYKWVLVYVNLWRIIPTYILCKLCKFKEKLNMDIEAWSTKQPSVTDEAKILKFGYHLINTKEFRNVLLMRLRRNPIIYVLTRCFFKPLDSLYINMPPEKIGGGLYFQHGFSTIVAAKQIGNYCSINQQVTVGYNGEEAPIIGDNVIISAGAIVIGFVHIKDNAVIGAGAVVTHDVEVGTTVVGVPARRII